MLRVQMCTKGRGLRISPYEISLNKNTVNIFPTHLKWPSKQINVIICRINRFIYARICVQIQN